MFKTTNRKSRFKWTAAAFSVMAALSTQAQVSQTLFSDDFDSGVIDPTKWRTDDKPFESGTSDIHADASLGVLEFTGTVTEQWWPGLALATKPSFTASMETNLVISVDRLAEFGSGTASRSAIWITDSTRSNFVVFADVRAEGGWRYNRKIGQNGDVPNGSGVDIAAFNGETFDDGGYHQMKVVGNGQTLKLYLDEILGAEVAFPFTKDIVVELGSYARATNDMALTQFDNFQIAAVGAISFSQQDITVNQGQTSQDVTVRIPAGSNATQPVQVQVTSTDPSIATPAGGSAGVLTLTFVAGGATSQTFKIQGVKSGGAVFTFQNDSGLIMANTLAVTVPFSIGTLLQDDFSTTLDLNKWEINNAGFETGTGLFDVSTSNGELVISGNVTEQYWAGASIRSKEAFVPTKDLNMVLEVDRPSMERTGTAARSALFLTTADRSQFVAFSQNNGEGGWVVNINPGNPTGGGTVLAPFADKNDLASHKLKIVADGEVVSVYLDGDFGGTFGFPVTSALYVEVGAYARANADTVNAHFDNVRMSGVLPCTDVSPTDVTAELGVTGRTFDIIIPKRLNESSPASVTVISSDPSVAVPAGAASGTLKLTFPAGATNRQSIAVTTVGPGVATFDVIDDQGGCVTTPLSVTVTPALLSIVSDDFASSTIDPTKWVVSEAGFGPGFLTNSTVAQAGGTVQFHVTPGSEDWPGITYATVDSFTAKATEPLIFEVDRVTHVGSGASTRTGVWITDATRANYIFFAYDDNDRGWQYNRRINAAGDNPNGVGTNIEALDATPFNGGGLHRLKILANGLTAKFYVDDVLGVEVPFPFANGIRFEFGAFARSVRDVVDATFDNATVRGPMPCIFTDVPTVTLENGGTNPVVRVTIPRLLNATREAKLTITSSNPGVAQPMGGNNGTLTLTFAAGASNEQSFQVQRLAPGTAQFSFSNAEGTCSVADLRVISFTEPIELFSDNFDSGVLDTSKWAEDSAPFETGEATAELYFGSGQFEITATGISNYWGGYGLTTTASFAASESQPVTFEADRTYMVDNGSTGVRSSFWVVDSTGTNWVVFSDLSESGLGWTYNRRINQTGDNPTGGGVDMVALNGGTFDDRGQHHVKLVANGSTVRFFVDGTLGAEVAYPVTSGIHFRVGAYTRAEFDLVSAGFDNVVVTGNPAPEGPGEIAIGRDASGVSITWDGDATLEESSTVTGGWTPVQNASSPYRPEATGTRFYRLKK